MSDQASIEVVRRIYQAIAEGDIPTRLSLVTDDLDLRMFGSDKIPMAGHWRGREGLEKFLSIIAASIDFQIFQPDEFINAGNDIIVLGHERCAVRSTGRVVEVNWAHVWTVRDGLIGRHIEYTDTAAWERGFAAADETA
jgi:ketosteroid isomerase-like protein